MTPSRRRVLVATASAVTAGLAGCTTDATPADRRTDDTETATPTETQAPDDGGDGPTDTPEVRWTASVGEATTNAPLVRDGTVFLGSDGGGGIDSGDESGHHLSALATADGSEQWAFETDKPVGGRPTVTDDGVYVTGGYDRGTAGVDYEVFALDRDGSGRWRFTDDALSAWYTVCGVVDGTVFVGSNDDAIGPGAYSAGVDTADGSTRWTREIGDATDGLPLDDHCLLSSATGLHAITTDGTVEWTFEGTDPLNLFGAVPFLAGGCVVVEADGVVALDPATGTVNWRYRPSESYVTGRIGVGDLVVARTDAGGLVGLDAATGTERWTDDGLGEGYGLAAVGDDRFAVATTDGYQVRTLADEHVGSFSVPGSRPRLTSVGETVFVWSDERERLDAFAADATHRWTFTPETAVQGLDAAAGVAYVATLDGTCHALAL
ncbi:outer membrane protein assembly factor BamB family protein [Haloarchaeobius litoreus]|uniref:PQQ-binding-like beta-propeller repeat protein n=1 Tax=Haloarchaeobius litoreus TaxID=755306 RepID=A0ABD6DJZ3_9EURY|nr:PQQ-binding-like beta-propeller repeat protein [Haloarchaeobius litoreus]